MSEHDQHDPEDAAREGGTAAKRVSLFEAHLLRIVRGFLGAMPAKQTQALVFREIARPPCLSRMAIDLLEDTLRKGCIRRLARAGWRTERFVRGDRYSEGRLWNRVPLEQRTLQFSAHTMQWLTWITAENPSTTRRKPIVQKEHMTIADRLLQFFAFEVLHDCGAAEKLARLPAFASNDLLWLGWPEVMSRTNVDDTPDFAFWTRPDTCWVLETLSADLANRWAQIESDKQDLADWKKVRAIGRTQTVVLERFCDRLEADERRDLARFLVRAVRRILSGTGGALPWFARLNVDDLRMAERAEVYRAGLALLHVVERFRQWEQRSRTIGYFDDGYHEAQSWLADWERWQGDSVVAAAGEIVRRFELLDVG